MTALVEESTYEEEIRQWETTDLALGGLGGVMNTPLIQLANRTKWLYDRIASLTEQPLAALPYPTIATSDNRLTVTPAAATAGGTVSIAAGTRLTLSEVVTAAATGRLRTFTTPAYISADLLANSTYYLRAQVDANGDLAIYRQRGTDSDAIPASQVGTPDASSGGGFDSTPVDLLIAKVATGSAGTVPVVTPLRNASYVSIDLFDRVTCGVSWGLATAVHEVNLARTIEPIVSPAGWSNVTSGTALANSFRDGLPAYTQRTSGTSPVGVICFAKEVSRYSVTIAAENAEEVAANETDNPVFYSVHWRG